MESQVPTQGHGLSHLFIRLSRSEAEAVPCTEQDGDGRQRRDPGRLRIGVVPVVDGEAQAGEREEDAEDSGDPIEHRILP
jgi:hypothetical protein